MSTPLEEAKKLIEKYAKSVGVKLIDRSIDSSSAPVNSDENNVNSVASTKQPRPKLFISMRGKIFIFITVILFLAIKAIYNKILFFWRI